MPARSTEPTFSIGVEPGTDPDSQTRGRLVTHGKLRHTLTAIASARWAVPWPRMSEAGVHDRLSDTMGGFGGIKGLSV